MKNGKQATKIKDIWKINIAVIIKRKKILSMGINDKHILDSTMLPELIKNIIKLNKITVGKLFADHGPNDGNDIFIYLADIGIHPCINVRKNSDRSGIKTGPNWRNLSVLAQRNDFKKENIESYVHRWIVEIGVFLL